MAADSHIADALRRVARQVAESTAASPLPSSIATPTEPSPSPTNTGSSGGGVTQSPLLFFVALGFGVVFTNLWIIVGVKYCFRYNARNRALAMQAQGDAIDLQNVNPQPRRRRRERKLLSMEEVNSQFPLQKYGTWMASRQSQGLPAEGGVDGANAAAVVERAQSLRNVDGVVEVVPTSPITSKHSMDKDTSKTETTDISTTPASPTAARQSIDITTAKSPTPVTQTITSHEKPSDPHILSKLQTNNTTHTLDPKHPDRDAAHLSDADGDSDDEDAIHAIHPDVTEHPGDSCAICIDTLEDDEDVRGLACGHAFHASCIDPWLTSRRACCPLCKRDYYVPKPRAEGEVEETPEERRRRRREREERRAARDGAAVVWGVRGTRIYLPGRFLGGGPVYFSEGMSRGQTREERRTHRAEIERQNRRMEERMAANARRRAERQEARRNGATPAWRMMLPFVRDRSRSPGTEARARAQPVSAAEAQVIAQHLRRTPAGQQPRQGGGRLGRLNPFSRGVGAGNAVGSGQVARAELQSTAAPTPTPTPRQVEAQTTTANVPRRGWIFR